MPICKGVKCLNNEVNSIQSNVSGIWVMTSLVWQVITHKSGCMEALG